MTIYFTNPIGRRCKAVFSLIGLIMSCLANIGCLDLLARGIMDPSGLATDVGTAMAENTARSVIAPTDVQSLQELDRTISRLDTIIAEGDESMAANDLKALRQHIADGRDQLIADQQVTDEAETVLSQKGPFAYSREAINDGARRLGDPNADPSWVAYQPYRQRQQPPFDRVRHNDFNYINPKTSLLTQTQNSGHREHDNGTAVALSQYRITEGSKDNYSATNFGIDLATGQLRQTFGTNIR